MQNSLLIKATPQEYFELKELITRLDKLPPQVALDVAIAEFDISDNFTAGISKFLFDSNLNEKEGSVVTIQPTKGSISFSGVFDSMTIDMSLIEEKSKSRVLSRPYLVVQDGESASITAGKQVPVQTGSTTTDGGTTTTEIQYRSTGVTLNVTPTINADGVVSLDIAQSVTGSEPGPAELNPIITDRSLKTSVMVGDGQTAILGGLIQNNDSNKGNAVPFLSDIPGLGNLFKAKADTFSRSELVIMITPKIMTSTLDLEEFSDSLRDVFTMKVGQETPQTQVLEITETP
ncbi:type II secretion system protein GspD [Vibrio parahaemolyticus]|nr:type II secretion system protein GspD [Vibrio parahaemolyticus]